MRAREVPFTYRHVPGSTSPVMLLPGLLGGDWIWQTTVERLGDAGYSTVVWNTAVAQLDRDVAASIVVDLCDAAVDVLDELSIGEALVCGNSLGALLGLELARRYPDRVIGMVLSGCPGLEDSVIDLDYILSHTQLEVAEEFRRRLFHHEPELLSPQLVEESMAMALHRPTVMNMLKVFRAARLHDTVDCLKAVACPTCVIWGEHDRITPFENWRPHLPLLRDSELHVVDDCGHSPMIEKEEEWLTLVTAFARRVLPRSEPHDALPEAPLAR